MNKLFLTLLVPALFLVFPFKAKAYTPSYYTQQSALATGHWVKVEVDTTSIFEISYDQLREWGFADPSKVSVHGLGAMGAANHNFNNTYPDDMPHTAYMHTDDGRLLFFGDADAQTLMGRLTAGVYYPSFARNYYDTHSYYFLTDNEPLKEVPSSAYSSSLNQTLGILDWHYCIDLHEDEVQNPTKGGVYFHGEILKAGDAVPHTFRIRDFEEGSPIGGGHFRYEAAVKNSSSQKFDASVSGVTPFSSLHYAHSTITSNSSRMYETGSGIVKFREDENGPLDDVTATFTFKVPATFKGSYLALDRVYMLYPRRNIIRDEALIINLYQAKSKQNVRIFNADANTRVWNVTNTAAITSMECKPEADSEGTLLVSIPSTATAPRLIAFNTGDTHRKPTFAGEVQNTNLHRLSTPHMLIVTTQTNRDAALELAAIHRELQGLDVEVAVQDDVFNEFSFGSRHPGAIRRLAKMFYDRDPSKFRYVLLYGQPTWDNRNIVRDKADFLVSYQVENLDAAKDPTTNACADQYFGMLSDSYLHTGLATTERMLVSVGRIPVDNPSLGRVVNRKIRDHIANPPTAREFLHSILLSDSGDAQAHIKQANEADSVLSFFNPEMTVTRADNLFFPMILDKAVQHRDIIHQALSQGAGFFNFSGHAGHNFLTGAFTYTSTTLTDYTYNHYPVAMLSTCNTWPMDAMAHTLSEEMLYKENGGMIGVIAACRSVYLEPNKTLNNAVAKEYINAAPGTMAGDLLRLARNTLITSGGGKMTPTLANNTLCYNFCGDPAVPIGAPDYNIVLDTFGQAVTDATVTVAPLANLPIKARITDAAGNTVSGFNGSAIIDVYERPIVRKTLSGSPSVSATCDNDIMTSIPATVSAGVISLSAPLPLPVAAGDYNRIVITATSTDGKQLAAGASTKVKISAEAAQDSDIDTSAPVIEQFYIDSPDFVSGQTTGSDIVVYAVIDPSATGLAFSSYKIANTTALSLDSGRDIPEAVKSLRPGADGKSYLTARLEGVADGEHTLTLRAVNNIGESVTSKIDFKVLSAPLGLVLSVDTPAPARTEAAFELDTKGNELTSSRIIIVNSKGETVLSRNVSFPYSWNLTDNNGNPVADGEYTASVIAEADFAKGSSNKVSVVVVK